MGVSDFEATAHAACQAGPDRKIAGFTAMCANSNGTLYNKSFGTITIDASAPALTEENTMQLMSCTKLVTSLCALQLIESGKLSLDADASELLPQLRNLQVMTGTDSSGRALTRPAKEKITLRRLLTHTSGFTYAGMIPAIWKWQKSHGINPSKSQGKFPEMLTMPLLFEPGTGWAYGVGIEYVGLLIEKVSGMTLFEYQKKHVFEPLGLKNFTFRLDARPDLEGRFVKTCKIDAEGVLRTGDSIFPTNAQNECGGAGLIGCAREYFQILRAIAAEDTTLMKKETYTMLYNVELAKSPGPMKMRMLNPNFVANAPEGAEDEDGEIGWGQGLASAIMQKEVTGNGQKLWMSQGTLHWSGMLNHYWFIDRKRDLVTFVATQVEPFDHPNIADLISLFHETMLEEHGKLGREAKLA